LTPDRYRCEADLEMWTLLRQPDALYLIQTIPFRIALRRNPAMALTVKEAVLWRKEIDNRPGMLVSTLEPLSEAGADLQVVMAYRDPGGTDTAAVELHPVSRRKPMAAAKTACRAPSDIAALLVEGDNRQGLGHAITRAIGDAGINLSFVMAQVVGRRYSAMFGFEKEADAAKATGPDQDSGGTGPKESKPSVIESFRFGRAEPRWRESESGHLGRISAWSNYNIRFNSVDSSRDSSIVACADFTR
jgi:hypothetical protein